LLKEYRLFKKFHLADHEKRSNYFEGFKKEKNSKITILIKFATFY